MNMVSLFCTAGQHTWDRASQRGRKPVNCPTHSSVPGPVSVSVTDEIELAEDAPTSAIIMPALTGEARAARLILMMRNQTRYGREVISA